MKGRNIRSSSNINILNWVFDNIDKFRTLQINIDDMVANLSANITALEGVDSEFVDTFQSFIGAIDFIKYTESQDVGYKLILKEVNKYDEYLKSYFSNE